ncbi:25426_t:CDS:2 [Gigaspora margarita]|uniref:25426_t:CDS:1 n=1 Tax=Gigaspora margarita TaxID=4874 RepID=A0ABN7VRS6_GIGMA|nr:25426_t:CDS:2 [Gigaspora margarita]
MPRKNRTPKQFLLTILNEHLKFLKRKKQRIPKKYHKDIETEEKRTKDYLRNAKKEFIDHNTLKNKFEKEKFMFNKKIDNFNREIRRLNSVIRKKDKEIEILQFDNNKKDNQIEELKAKMKYLGFENSNLSKQVFNLFPWKRLMSTDKLLLEICSYLSSKDLFTFIKVEKLLYKKLWSIMDFQQLQGGYLGHSEREFSGASHLVFYSKRDIENTFKKYLEVPKNKKQEWLNKRIMIAQEYYNNILKIKHPAIEDQYLLSHQQLQYQLTHQTSFYIPEDFNFE